MISSANSNAEARQLKSLVKLVMPFFTCLSKTKLLFTMKAEVGLLHANDHPSHGASGVLGPDLNRPSNEGLDGLHFVRKISGLRFFR